MASDPIPISDLRSRLKKFEPEHPTPGPEILSLAQPLARNSQLFSSKALVGTLCAIPVLIFGTLCVVRPAMVTLAGYDAEGNVVRRLVFKKLFGWTMVLGLIFCGAAFGIIRYIRSK